MGKNLLLTRRSKREAAAQKHCISFRVIPHMPFQCTFVASDDSRAVTHCSFREVSPPWKIALRRAASLAPGDHSLRTRTAEMSTDEKCAVSRRGRVHGLAW